MQQYRMPDEHYRTLKNLLRLRPDEIDALNDAMLSLSPMLSIPKISSAIYQQIELRRESAADSALDRRFVADLIDFLLTVFPIARAEETEKFTEFVLSFFIDDLRSRNELEQYTPTDDWAQFRQRLSRLLDARQPLRIVEKAFSLWLEHENTLHDLRIVTDIRPIYGDNPSDGPSAAIIVHRLKLSYHSGGGIDEFFISVDTDDIERLRLTLGRAEEKAENLKKILFDSSIKLVES